MSFTPTIPAVTDPILLSAFQLRANFQAIASSFAVNHMRLNGSPELAGIHTAITLKTQSGDPVTSVAQVSLYNKLVGGIPEIFYMPNNAQTPIQLTYPSIKVDESATQYSFIAGPFIVYMGYLVGITNGQMVTLSPGTTHLYVDMTAANVSKKFNDGLFAALAQPIATNLTGMTFTIQNQPHATGTLDSYYFAIGM